MRLAVIFTVFPFAWMLFSVRHGGTVFGLHLPHGRGLNAMGGISNCFSTLKKLDSWYSEPWTMKDGLILVNTLQSCLE